MDNIIQINLKEQESKKINQNIVSKNRIDYIDVARGISIILMVLGHVIGQRMEKRFNIFFSYAIIYYY